MERFPVFMALAYGFVGFTTFLVLLLLWLAWDHRRSESEH